MIKNVEIYNFSKKPKFLFVNNCNISKNKGNYSTERGKKYSELFNRILNSNKQETKNGTTKSLNNIKKKKNNIKKISFFRPEELTLNKYSNIINIQKNINTNPFFSNKKEFHNINNNECIIKKTEIKEKIKRIKKKRKKTNKEITKNNSKIIKTNKNFDKNVSDKLLKEKQKENKKDEIYYKTKQNKKDIKNNLKFKKVNIVNDNEISFDLKCKNKNEKINFIFKQKFQKNYEVKKQTLSDIKCVTKNIFSTEKTSEREKRSERIINESINIIDSFTKNLTLKSGRTIDTSYTKNANKIGQKYINDDNSHSLLKTFNNAEMNTMNSTGIIDMQTSFNKKSIKKLKYNNESRNKKKLLINKSENITIKKYQKYDKEVYNKKNSEIKNANKRKMVQIQIRNIDTLYDSGFIPLCKINPSYYENKFTDNNIHLDSYNTKKKENLFLHKMYSVDKENSKKKTRNHRRKHETVMNNIDNIGKKLLILVNDFHNKVHQTNDRSFTVQSGKLIDKIRALKKLNNI